METKILIIPLVIAIIGFAILVSATDFIPQGNINLMEIYNITGAPYVNATIYYGDGSSLTGIGGSGTVTSVATDDTYLTGGAITSTGTITFNTTFAGIYLAVNSSDYWDNLGSPSDINAGDITDDGTYLADLSDDTSPSLGGYLDTAGNNLGSTSDEIENVYVATDSKIYFGNGQEGSVYYNGTNLIISG